MNVGYTIESFTFTTFNQQLFCMMLNNTKNPFKSNDLYNLKYRKVAIQFYLQRLSLRTETLFNPHKMYPAH